MNKFLILCLDMDIIDAPGDNRTGAGHLYVKESIEVLKMKNIETVVITRRDSLDKPVYEVIGSVHIWRIEIGEIKKQNKEFLAEKIDEIVETVSDLLIKIEFQPTVIHSHYRYSGAIGRILKNKLKCKMIYSVISLGKIKHDRQEYKSFHDTQREITEKLIFTDCDLILAVSIQEAQNIEQFYEIDNKKIYVIGRGVDMKLFRPLTNIYDENKVLLFIGRLVESKGLGFLLQVYEYIYQNKRQIGGFLPSIWIAGGTREEIDYFKSQFINTDILKDLNSQGKILWRGKLDRNFLPIIYNKTLLTCVPSYYEPGARVILESMSCGTPVIMSPTGYSNEIVFHNNNGFICEHDIQKRGDIILGYIKENFEKKDKIVKRAIARIEKGNSMRVFFDNHWEVYSQFIY